jgi:E3 ubiquitin-protein ligase TTC3
LAKYKAGKDLQKEYEILTIYIYSPFLYGDHIDPYHWESQWFSWFRKVNLISQRHFSTEQLSLQEIRVLEILGLTLDWSWRQFVFLEKVSYLEWVMDLWEEVDGKKDIDRVIEEVKEKNWFNEILEMISTQPVDLRLNNSELKNPLAIELCVLYAVCHLGYQLKTRKDNVTSFQDEMKANMQRAHENHKQEIDANLENAEMSFLMCERLENVELYNKAIRLSPFDVKLYESRLKANFLTSYYQDAASDSMRILCLQKDHKIAHLCLIKSLKELNEVTRAEIATRLFYTYYPSSIDRDSLQELLANSGRDLFTIDCPVSYD